MLPLTFALPAAGSTEADMTSATYDAANRLTAWGSTSLGHDLAGT